MTKYKLSRRKYSSIAIAAVCHILQHNHEQDQLPTTSNSEGGRQFNASPSQWINKRNAWLRRLASKFPQIDLDDAYSVLFELREGEGMSPPISFAQPFEPSHPNLAEQIGRLSLEPKVSDPNARNQ